MMLTFHRIGAHEFAIKTAAGAAIPSPRPSSATPRTPPAAEQPPRSRSAAPDPSGPSAPGKGAES